MTALKAAAAVLFLLFLLGLLRVGGGGEYSAAGFRAWVRLGPLHIGVFPPGEKKKKKEQKAKKPEKEKPPEQEPPRQREGAAAQLRAYLPLACQAAGELRRRIRIDELLLDFTMAGKEDAASAAMSFGYSNAAAGMILSLLEQNFEVGQRRVRAAVDFNADASTVYLRASVSGRLGQLVSFVLRFGWKFFRAYRQTQNQKKEAI